jgi:hypothetical protein
MQEEILNKLHAALYHISPLASDRERIIEQMGETIWLETLTRVLTALPENTREEVVTLLNDDKIEEAIEVVEVTDVDIEKIMIEASTDIMKEVTGED